VVGQVNNQVHAFEPTHMNINLLTQYPKEHLIEVKQTPIHVGDSPKKLATRDKIEPLGF
jgi:hypothetical protein